MERENLSLNNLQECSFSVLRDFIYGAGRSTNDQSDLPSHYIVLIFRYFFWGGRGQWLQLLFDKKNNNNSVLHVQIF